MFGSNWLAVELMAMDENHCGFDHSALAVSQGQGRFGSKPANFRMAPPFTFTIFPLFFGFISLANFIASRDLVFGCCLILRKRFFASSSK